MAKVKYTAKENKKVGTHSFYAVPVYAGTLTTDEILAEALDGKSIEPSVAKAAITEYMKAVQRNVMKGFRCQLGDQFLTVYPNLQLSVKDTEDKETGETIVATADMLNAANGKSRLGCTVATKFSQTFAANVQWQKVSSASETEEQGDDITDGGDNTQTGGDTPGEGELEP